LDGPYKVLVQLQSTRILPFQLRLILEALPEVLPPVDKAFNTLILSYGLEDPVIPVPKFVTNATPLD